MENFENERKYVKCKEGCLKYFVIFIATIIGAFLAFYVVTDYTIKTMLSPEYQMRKAEKLMKKMDRQIAREINRDVMVVGKTMSNPVNIIENKDGYLVEISLKDFSNNPEKINVTVDENNVLKIEGTNEIKKGDKEKMISMLQTYKLNKKVNTNKMTKQEERGMYVIKLPFEVE